MVVTIQLWRHLKRCVCSIFDESWRAGLAAVFAFIGAILGSCWSDIKRTETFTSQLNDAGVGYPSLLFHSVRKEDDGLTLRFVPEELERVAVCEFFSGKQPTFRMIMDEYLDKYSGCFFPIMISPTEIEIRANIHSGQLEKSDDGSEASFWCKCAPSQIEGKS